MSIAKVLIATYSCPKCGSMRVTQLQELEPPCQKIRCHQCDYEGSPFVQASEDEVIEDELSGSWWTCPNCGHHAYTIRTSYEGSYDYQDWGVTTMLVCTCCGYKV